MKGEKKENNAIPINIFVPSREIWYLTMERKDEGNIFVTIVMEEPWKLAVHEPTSYLNSFVPASFPDRARAFDELPRVWAACLCGSRKTRNKWIENRYCSPSYATLYRSSSTGNDFYFFPIVSNSSVLNSVSSGLIRSFLLSISRIYSYRRMFNKIKKKIERAFTRFHSFSIPRSNVHVKYISELTPFFYLRVPLKRRLYHIYAEGNHVSSWEISSNFTRMWILQFA